MADRETIQPVRIEIAEHHHPLATVACQGESLQRAFRIRKQAWIVQTGERLGEPGGQVVPTEDAPACQ